MYNNLSSIVISLEIPRKGEEFERGFINKKKILEYVSEEQIFELVFGFEPVECEYVESPFRDDRNPGCWFQYCPSGKLRFVDFANSSAASVSAVSPD